MYVGRWVYWSGYYTDGHGASHANGHGAGLCLAEDDARLLVWAPMQSAGPNTYSYPDCYDVPLESARLATTDEIQAARARRGIR